MYVIYQKDMIYTSSDQFDLGMYPLGTLYMHRPIRIYTQLDNLDKYKLIKMIYKRDNLYMIQKIILNNKHINMKKKTQKIYMRKPKRKKKH